MKPAATNRRKFKRKRGPSRDNSSFKALIKQRSGSVLAEPLAPCAVPQPQGPEIPLDTSAPAYNPEPTFLATKDAKTSDILTPGSKSEWSREDFPWSEQITALNSLLFQNESFKPCQKEAINALMAGRNVFACMPTGAGKSLLYQIPGIASRGLTVVIMPLISLIKDQIDFLDSKCIRAKALIGPMSLADQREVMQLLEEDESVQILLTTPERLVGGPGLQSILQTRYETGKLARLVIDEAHCLSKWGTDFRADYLKLADVTAQFPKLPVLCLTSTAPERVREDILDRLSLADPLCFLTSLNRPNLTYEVKAKTDQVKKEIASLIANRFPGQSGIIYCLSKKECDDLAKLLRRQYGVAAGAYHASHTNKERTMVQEDWLRGDLKVVVATIAFGLGINKKDVRFVIHATLPKSLEDYYQESGRAGRDGAVSTCVLFYSYKDKARLDFLLQTCPKRSFQTTYSDLCKMMAYCEDEVTCRRHMLLAHFGEQIDPELCEKRCDNCQRLGLSEDKDVTDIAKKVLRAVMAATNVTLLQLIAVLRGEKGKPGDKRKPGFAELKRYPADELRRVIIVMCAEGLLEQVPANCKKLCYTFLRPGAGVYLLSQPSYRLTIKVTMKVKPEKGKEGAAAEEKKEDGAGNEGGEGGGGVGEEEKHALEGEGDTAVEEEELPAEADIGQIDDTEWAEEAEWTEEGLQWIEEGLQWSEEETEWIQEEMEWIEEEEPPLEKRAKYNYQ